MNSIIWLLTFWDTTHHKLGSPKAEKSSYCIEDILQIFWKSRYFDLLLLNTQIEKKCKIVRVWCVPTSFSSFPFIWNQYRNIISICVYILYFLMCFKAIFYSMKIPILIMFILYTFIFQSRPQSLVHFLWTEKSLHWPRFSKWTEPEI